jgi:hypothetical protein
MNAIKVAIWSLAISGMTPAVLLAVLNLTSNISLARHLKKEAEQEVDDNATSFDGVSRLTLCYMDFGRKHRLEVTSLIWPSAVLLVGAGTFAVGLLNLIPSQMQSHNVGGIEMVDQYVGQVIDSHKPPAYLVISLVSDEYTALSIASTEEHRSIDFYLTKKEQIAPVLAFFSKRGIGPMKDEVTEEGTEFETRHLSYPVDRSTSEVGKLCREVFTEAYGVEKDTELIFTVGN